MPYSDPKKQREAKRESARRKAQLLKQLKSEGSIELVPQSVRNHWKQSLEKLWAPIILSVSIPYNAPEWVRLMAIEETEANQTRIDKGCMLPVVAKSRKASSDEKSTGDIIQPERKKEAKTNLKSKVNKKGKVKK